MAKVIEDVDSLLVSSDLLNVLLPDQFIETPKRLIPGCHNLYWWMRCFPNGCNNESQGHVGVFVYTSIGGFENTMTVTIQRSNIKLNDTDFYSKPSTDGWSKVASHATLNSGDIIKNDIFVVKCEVVFKFPEAATILEKVESHEESCVIKFDRKIIETYKPGQIIRTEKQNVGDITWWTQNNPCGETESVKGNVSAFCHITGGPITIEYSYAMSISGVLIHVSHTCNFDKNSNRGLPKIFTHEQCLLADHKNGIIDLVCKVRLVEPSLLKPISEEPKLTQPSAKDSIIAEMLECQLDDNEIAEFDTTPKQFAKDSGKHQWRLKWFPAGDSFGGKRHISLFIEASTTESKTVTLSGIVKIIGTTFEKKFNMFVETDSSCAFQKLISHEELRRIGGIVDGKVKIECEATFHTLSELRLN